MFEYFSEDVLKLRFRWPYHVRNTPDPVDNIASGNLVKSGSNSDSSVPGEEVYVLAHLHAVETQYVEVNLYNKFSRRFIQLGEMFGFGQITITNDQFKLQATSDLLKQT